MKLFSLLITLFILPLLTASDTNHEYYVSVTNVEYAQEKQSLQIISQIFIDDFEKILRKRYDENLTLATENEAKIVEDYMKRYLEQKLEININGTDFKFNFIGKEYIDDITYCYLEIENITEIKSIEVTNRILFDTYTDQQNIVKLKVYDRYKNFLLVPDNDKCVLNFD